MKKIQFALVGLLAVALTACSGGEKQDSEIPPVGDEASSVVQSIPEPDSSLPDSSSNIADDASKVPSGSGLQNASSQSQNEEKTGSLQASTGNQPSDGAWNVSGALVVDGYVFTPEQQDTITRQVDKAVEKYQSGEYPLPVLEGTDYAPYSQEWPEELAYPSLSEGSLEYTAEGFEMYGIGAKLEQDNYTIKVSLYNNQELASEHPGYWNVDSIYFVEQP